MLKFIIFFGAVLYLLSRFSTQIFRFALWLLGKQIEKEVQRQQAKANGMDVKGFGDIKIIYHQQPPQKNNATTGSYVDYEEVPSQPDEHTPKRG